MTGSSLFDFIIVCVVLIGAGILFMLAIDGLSTDDRFKKIARVAIGVCVLVALLIAIRGLFFGGGALSVSPYGVIVFAASTIAVLVILYLIKMVVDKWVKEYSEPIMYVTGALLLIILLLVAANTLFGVGVTARPFLR
jgi:succinate dehydrogenase hydrophobic anchor subunit